MLISGVQKCCSKFLKKIITYKVIDMNILKSSIVITSMVMSVSCIKDIEINYTEIDNSITVRSEVATKSGYDNSNLPTEFIMDIVQLQDESEYNYHNIRMVKATDNNTYRAVDLNGNTLPLQWASTDHSRVYVKSMTLPGGVEQLKNGVVTIDVSKQANDGGDAVKKYDILVAETGDGVRIDGNDIIVNFHHIMSKFCVTYELEGNVKVESISLNNVRVQGNYSYTDMGFVNESSSDLGSIDMFIDGSNTAEAMFLPYTPATNPNITINALVNGKPTEFGPTEITLKKTNGFLGGKRYVVKIKITEQGLHLKGTADDLDWVKNVPDGKILWIGTSIPAKWDLFGPNNNYPQMIADATGLKIINNAIPSSYVTFDPYILPANWDSYTNAVKFINQAASLSATKQEIELKYTDLVQRLIDSDPIASAGDTTPAVIDLIHSFSYSGQIIPHINGTPGVEQCSVIVLDHGYNDSAYITMECSGWNFIYGLNETPVGYSWISSLAQGGTYVDSGDGTHLYYKRSYIQAMEYVINACVEEAKKNNRELKIIIGNYFATRTPVFHTNFADFGGSKCVDLLLMANQAVANRNNLDIVNVYEYTGLDSETDWTAYYNFCPTAEGLDTSNVHPSSDLTGTSNGIIANAYLNEFRRIFGEDYGAQRRVSAPTSYDCTWEDVEL